MSWRSVLRAITRASLVLAVALSGLTFSLDEAEARRGGRIRSHSDHSSSHDSATTAKRKSGDEPHDGQGADSSSGTYVPGVRVRSREAARGSETESDVDDPTSPRRRVRHRAMSFRPTPDLEVPGCAAGMICTVCLAGCSGDAGSIVDAQAKTPIPKPQR